MALRSLEVMELAPRVATSWGSSPSASRALRVFITASCTSGIMVLIGCNWQKLVCNRSEFVDHYARTRGFVSKKASKWVQPNLTGWSSKEDGSKHHGSPVGCEICDHWGRHSRPIHRLPPGAEAHGNRQGIRQGP